MTTSNLDAFLQEFLPLPPKGDAAETALTRIRYWIEVYNHPEKFIEDPSPYALRAKRRSARQNVRRLLKNHSELLPMLQAEGQQ